MFAVIKTGGKQYRVAADDLIEVDKIAGEAGAVVSFAEVLAVGGEETLLGAPTVAGATVRGEVVEQARKPKVIAFKKRRRKNSRRKRGHRQEFTLVRITEIVTGAKDQPKPAKAKVKSDEAVETAASVQSHAETAPKPAPAQPKAETAEQPAPAQPKAESAEKPAPASSRPASATVADETAAPAAAPKKEAGAETASPKSRPDKTNPADARASDTNAPEEAEQDKPK